MNEPGKLYTGFTAQQLQAAEAIGEIREFARGQTIFQEGEPGDCMYVVLRGSVAISKNAESGHEQLLGRVGPGDYFGEMSLIDSQTRSAQAVASESALIRILRRRDIDQLLAINPEMMINLSKSTCDRLRTMNRQFIEQIVHQEKMSLVGQMASSIIHDIKNPMTVISMSAGLMGRNPLNAELSRTIILHADRITAMVNDLLDYARGVVRLNRQDVDPKKWFVDLAELLAPLVSGHDMKLRCEVTTHEHLCIDADRMTRAIYNLAANAVEAMTADGVLTLRLSKPGDGFRIEVSDTGNGIPEAIRDRLLEPFVTCGKRGGTGLGTSIAKKIVEDHGGTISFTTETGKGTSFDIRIPITVQEQTIRDVGRQEPEDSYVAAK